MGSAVHAGRSLPLGHRALPLHARPMKTLARLLLLIAVCSLSACLFKEPVFTEGFAKIDPALGGVWATNENGDPRQTEFAVCAPLDGDRYILQYPAGEKGTLLYEGRLLHVRG